MDELVRMLRDVSIENHLPLRYAAADRIEAMPKTRREVAEYINGPGDRAFFELPIPDGVEKNAAHWGKCEIRSLLDFIYGGLPAPDETVFGEFRLRNVVGKRV